MTSPQILWEEELAARVRAARAALEAAEAAYGAFTDRLWSDSRAVRRAAATEAARMVALIGTRTRPPLVDQVAQVMEDAQVRARGTEGSGRCQWQGCDQVAQGDTIVRADGAVQWRCPVHRPTGDEVGETLGETNRATRARLGEVIHCHWQCDRCSAEHFDDRVAEELHPAHGTLTIRWETTFGCRHHVATSHGWDRT